MDDKDLDKSSLPVQAEILLVGQNLRDLRKARGFSLRNLAKSSGLNINTLSMIENGKTSPSVSTLQQLALALKVPLSAFFDTTSIDKQIVFTSADERPLVQFGNTMLESLGRQLAGHAVQPFVIKLAPEIKSGEMPIAHTGYEFVFCLHGKIEYRILDEVYLLETGDSLVFQAHLAHSWQNIGKETTEILLIFFPSELGDTPDAHHFKNQTLRKEDL